MTGLWEVGLMCQQKPGNLTGNDFLVPVLLVQTYSKLGWRELPLAAYKLQFQALRQPVFPPFKINFFESGSWMTS